MTNPLVNLVQTQGQQAFTTSLIVAEGCPVERKNKTTGALEAFPRDHRDVLKLVKKYRSEFEELGGVRFQTAPFETQGGTQNIEVAILNEDQATYLITLFTNTTIVRKFKLSLVKAFRAALNEIARLQAIQPEPTMYTPEWFKVRAEGIVARREETDAIKLFVEYARSHESTIKLIRKYQSDFEELGGVRFEIQPFATAGGIQDREVALLNEDQATYLITLFRNTPTVRKFKLNLVKAFRAALNEIARLYADPPRTGLITDKRKSMWDMTDALKEIRAENGKDTEAKHYVCENKLINWCINGKFAKLDEKSLSNEEMDICKKLRVKNAAFIRADMEYAERKVKLKEYAARLQNIKLLS